MKRTYPDDPADYRCVMLCKQPKCKAAAMTNGLCCEHYLKALDKFEARSRKRKVRAKLVLSFLKPFLQKKP